MRHPAGAFKHGHCNMLWHSFLFAASLKHKFSAQPFPRVAFVKKVSVATGGACLYDASGKTYRGGAEEHNERKSGGAAEPQPRWSGDGVATFGAGGVGRRYQLL